MNGYDKVYIFLLYTGLALLLVMISNQLTRVERLLEKQKPTKEVIEANYQLDLWKEYRRQLEKAR